MASSTDKTTYRQLYCNFALEFVLFLLTLNIAASMFQAWEQTHDDVFRRKLQNSPIVRQFSTRYDIEKESVKQLLVDMKEITDGHREEHVLGYTDALILTLSLFCTIGWGHVYPKSMKGKWICIIGSCIGIPITFKMIRTGARLATRLVSDVIKISLSGGRAINDPEIEKRIMVATRKLLVPSLFGVLIAYLCLTALVVSSIGNFSYFDAFYYCFVTLTSIGIGDLMKSPRVSEHVHPANAVMVTVFLMFWTIFGMTFVAAIIFTMSLSSVNNEKVARKDLCFGHGKGDDEMRGDEEGDGLVGWGATQCESTV